MKLTEEIVLAMGFVKVNNSINPVTYWMDGSAANRLVIGFENDGTWSLRSGNLDSTSYVGEICDLFGLVRRLATHFFREGCKSKANEISRTLGLS